LFSPAAVVASCVGFDFDRVHGRTSNRMPLGVSYALMAAGSLGFALSPTWPLALIAALVAGFGFGGIDYGLNQLFAVGFGRRGPAMLNILNAHFGVGAIRIRWKPATGG
jgi:MFS family permease